MPAKKKSKRDMPDTVKLTLDLPDSLFLALKQSAAIDLRTNSKQAQYLIELGLSVLNSQMQMTEEGTQEEEPLQEAIGFKVDPPDEGDDDCEEDSKGRKSNGRK